MHQNKLIYLFYFILFYLFIDAFIISADIDYGFCLTFNITTRSGDDGLRRYTLSILTPFTFETNA